jgi:hypothetical protein
MEKANFDCVWIILGGSGIGGGGGKNEEKEGGI